MFSHVLTFPVRTIFASLTAVCLAELFAFHSVVYQSKNNFSPVLAPSWESNATVVTGGKYRKNQLPLLEKTDKVYKGGYNEAPIVIEKHKLLFFTEPKVACSVIKMLLRRMQGLNDWNVSKLEKIHAPSLNGLKYLNHYPLDQAQHMMTSPSWTRAFFVRDPKDRFLSAFLDKAYRTSYAARWCCAIHFKLMGDDRRACVEKMRTFDGFLELIRGDPRLEESSEGLHMGCQNEHWRPYYTRIDEKFWPFVNFIGQFDSLSLDIKRLLLQVGGEEAWLEYGATGWGDNGTEVIFETAATSHTTKASDKFSRFYETQEMERQVEAFYAEDYRRFNFSVTERGKPDDN